MSVRRRIAFVTGTRADYGLLRSSMVAAAGEGKLTPQVIVTGMHLLKKFGHTVDQVRRDGFRVDARVPMQTGADVPEQQARALARGVGGIARQLRRLHSEVVVVLGDRVEALAGALAASTTDCFLAHIHGGDVAPGHLDDAFRHAITKLAHLHFPATKDAARRIIRLGEWPDSVHVVGAPGLDDLADIPAPPPGWLQQTYGLDPDREAALIVWHPLGRPRTRERQVMSMILSTVQRSGLSGVVIYPNSDPGHEGIIQAIRQRVRRAPRGQWKVVRSLPREQFLRTLKAARLLVGNSSCGIIEAHSAGTPAVNIGHRQDGRLRSGRSVVDCAEKSQGLAEAIRSALRKRVRTPLHNVYGEGRAGRRIAHLLAHLPLSDNLRRKRIRY